MQKNNARPGQGSVKIKLITADGTEFEDFTLVPSLKAITTLSRLGGGDGLSAIHRRIANLDIDTYCQVIANGLGLEGQGARELPGRVYETGMIDLVGPVSDYVSILLNGGRPVDRSNEDNPPGANS